MGRRNELRLVRARRNRLGNELTRFMIYDLGFPTRVHIVRSGFERGVLAIAGAAADKV